ncbi:hypothetical protein HZS55_21280 [Halosimplex rubrum]|uniref:DNA recombination and repair protein Rad51-like C-terminal domain-containing protein n=1 Tax=Halosimplex rubrum TaxID=869889 RepID=A0A7D5T0N0_9EURY|nr:hypothetical protein [Halosimplex rubrum]QLH79671.1 hypothetical protein HZS55_21280 [Halosimplex rubrum]
MLPSLDPGLTLLDTDTDRSVPVVHAVVCDHLLDASGPAFWIDAQGYATTATLTQIAPSQRLLDRIHVARGFTAYQHFSALADLSGAVNAHVKAATTTDAFGQRDATDDTDTQPTPALIVAPAVDALYRADDTLGDAQVRRLLARSLARLRQYADAYDVPVLCTRTEGDALTDPIEAAATHHYTCESTRMGPRITGEEFEPQWYPVAGGDAYQTTLAYWADLLAARAEGTGHQPATPSSPSMDTDDSEGQVTTAPARQPDTPLLATWAGQPGRGP